MRMNTYLAIQLALMTSMAPSLYGLDGLSMYPGYVDDHIPYGSHYRHRPKNMAAKARAKLKRRRINKLARAARRIRRLCE